MELLNTQPIDEALALLDDVGDRIPAPAWHDYIPPLRSRVLRQDAESWSMDCGDYLLGDTADATKTRELLNEVLDWKVNMVDYEAPHRDRELVRRIMESYSHKLAALASHIVATFEKETDCD